MPDARARAAYLAYRAGADLARRLPPALGDPAGRALARAMAVASGPRRRQVERNLRRIAGPLSRAQQTRAVGATFDNYGRYWLELFRLPGETRASIAPRLRCQGLEHLESATAAGRGAILALPHLGNWDFAGAWITGRGYRLTVVAEPVEPQELFDWFSSLRTALGMEVLALGPKTAPHLLGALERNRAVCLVCDRDLTGDGVEVEFFGERTTLPAGPAFLALRSGAPLLPTGVYLRPNGGHAATILPPLDATRRGRFRADVERVTQDLARAFETLIRPEPEQWLMLQPNWPSDREAEARYHRSSVRGGGPR